jgi:AcrR family transcriptional regulator
VADSGSEAPIPRKRSDARRNEETLLAAAAATFVASGVDVPVRAIAARAGLVSARCTGIFRRGPISS